MPTTTITDLPACMVTEQILMANPMNACHLIATTLAENEVEQPPLGIQEGIIRDKERLCVCAIQTEPVTARFVE